MRAFANYFDWPLRDAEGRYWVADSEDLRANLAEAWVFGSSFYEAWDIAKRCGRLYEVVPENGQWTLGGQPVEIS